MRHEKQRKRLELSETVGRYEIVGELGAGSMSIVYLAHDPNLDRKVALKVVLQNWTLDSKEQGELERRFLLEARAAGKLSHPGIVRVYDADTDPQIGIPYITMEWVQGRSLRTLLEDRGKLDAPDTLALLAQVADALGYAHHCGRIHRDIKPSNILIGTDGKAKVSDFGVAKIVSESHTISGQVLGTPAYMSPEQVRDDPLDGRSDLFSLGAVLYQCVTGATPFGGDSLVQVVYKILNVDPRPLRLPTTPAWSYLAGVIRRALEKDPNARFQTGAEFACALEEARQLLVSDPERHFRASDRSEESRVPSDTVSLPPEVLESPGIRRDRGQTLTVELSTTQVQRAVGKGITSDSPASEVFETVASSAIPAVAQRPRRGPRLAALAVLVVAAVVLVALRFARPFPESVEVPLPAPASISDSARVERQTPINQVPVEEKDIPSPVVNEPAAAPPARFDPPRNNGEPAEAEQHLAPETVEALTPVTIVYRHRGGVAYLTVLLDGVRVWSQELKPVAGRIAKLTGYESLAVVPVPTGEHTLAVHLVDPERSVDAVKSIRSRYTNGRRRTLKVNLDSSKNEIQLRWKE